MDDTGVGKTTTIKHVLKILIDAEPNGDTYMSSRLKALDAQQIIQANFCKGRGNTKFTEVANDVELIIDNLFPKNFKDIIAKNYVILNL